MRKVIGIAGGTAGGKSTFAQKLAGALEEKGVAATVIHMDEYFRAPEDRPHVRSHLSGRTYVDDNSPETVDLGAFREAVAAAREDGDGAVIAEGLLVLWDDALRDLLDLRVFVDCAADERIVRRLRRNTEWGIPFDRVADVYLDMVRFRHEQYVEPTKWTADVIVNGAGDTAKACGMIARFITE